MRPRIALSTYDEDVHWDAWNRRADVLPASYARAVYRAGGCPILLPAGDPGTASDALRGADGLVITGGPDIDSQIYQAHVMPTAASQLPVRDHWEIALLDEAARRDLPTLGICRGMQLMNIHRGGTLHQHLPDVVGHEGHRIAPGVFAQHQVNLAPGSQLATVLGEVINATTYHHQAIHELGRGVSAVGWADDGTIEAIEIAERSLAVGVQWHPEESADATLFAALVERAAKEGEEGRTESSMTLLRTVCQRPQDLRMGGQLVSWLVATRDRPTLTDRPGLSAGNGGPPPRAARALPLSGEQRWEARRS